jgi:2,4-dienoyl-CoA reductase (NADPH2)
MVMGYEDAIRGTRPIGKSVAIIGAGGIGFDVAELVSHAGKSAALDRDVFAKEWGIDFAHHPRGGVAGVEPVVEVADRQIFLLQRKPTSPGRGLGPTTGWAHKLALKRRGVIMMPGVQYDRIDDHGLHITHDDKIAAAAGGHDHRLRRAGVRAQPVRRLALSARACT